MADFFCKCGRKFKKSGEAATTGYRLDPYGFDHECYDCPYVLPVTDARWNYQTKKYDFIVRAWECRASKTLSYSTYAALYLGSKTVGSIYSLDFLFLESVQAEIDRLDGVQGDREKPGERGVQYGSDGLYRLPVYPEQNKKGIAAKQKLFDTFFMPDGGRKDVTPGQEKMIVLKRIEEATMGKINLSNINDGLNKVKTITETLANVARFEMIPMDLIEAADYNPFAEQDTDDSRYRLAMSIQASGLIEPLAVNKKSSDHYKLISGEHRFTSIQQYLDWKTVPCMVFEGISDDEAQLKLYEANTYREYTSEQKFERYQELEKLLRRMKESGKFSGGLQKAIAERLGVTERQVRKYKTIDESLSDEQKAAVISGDISVNDAYKIARPDSSKSGTSSAFSEIVEPEQQEPPEVTHKGTSEFKQEVEEKTEDRGFWDSKIKTAIKRLYDPKELYRFYLFEVPTTSEAIKEKLKPTYGYSAGTIIFENQISGFCTCRSAQIEIECGKKNLILTYSQVDDYLRKMIRAGELISKQEAHDIIMNEIN